MLLDVHYQCPRCACEWWARWTCACDDDCPQCGMRHIEALEWEDAPAEDQYVELERP